MTSKFTEEQKQQAMERAQQVLDRRQEWAREHVHNSFAAWGNDKCISRTMDTIQNMRDGVASDNQYRYWLNN